MANQDQVVWTVVPQGFVAADTVRISVLVSPRLGFTAPLPTQPVVGLFDDWSDWPATLAHSKFNLVIDGVVGPTIKPSSQPDSNVWRAMMPKNTPVVNFQFIDLSTKVVLSYPVALLAQSIQDLYAKIGAASPQTLPTKAQLQPAIRRLVGEEARDKKAILAALHNPQQLSTLHGNSLGAISLLSAYHTSLNAEEPGHYPKKGPSDPRESTTWAAHHRTKPPTPKQLADSIDFHKIAASAIQHHDLARWMGLVLDFDIPAAQAPDGAHTLSLRVDRGAHAPADLYPVTQVNKKAPSFEAAPKVPATTLLSGRFLNIKATGLDLVQMDVDGAGLKLKNFSESVDNLKVSAHDDEDFGDKPDPRAGTPSLRTAGLMLAQARRDLAAKAAFSNSSTLQAGAAPGQTIPTLYAEDLVRGYRVDVKDQSGANKWFSLMERVVDFTFLNGGLSRTGVLEEGMLRMAAGSSTDGSNPNVMKIHEGLFVWRGWSLAAPEPFMALAKDGDPATPVPPVTDQQGDPPPAGLPLKTKVVARKGSLPKLRFGHRYAVRVRMVDLTGGSLSPETLDQPLAALSDTQVYRRFEPVEPPAIALPVNGGTQEKPADGESMGRAAVRTFNSHPDSTEADNIPVNHDQVGRLIAPPRVSARFAEPHGVLDSGDKLNPTLFDMLSKQDRPFRTDPPLTSPPPNFAIAEVGARLPYLPDPMALGVAIRIAGIDNINPATVFKMPLYGDSFDPNALPKWPEAQTFVIVGSEGISVPEIRITATERVFAVPLRKGERAILRLSCLMPSKRLDDMALYGAILGQAGGGAGAIAKAMDDGQHWMLTPWTTMELVHAVQKPLITPDLSQLLADRSGLGQLDAQLTFNTPLSAHSTAKIDMQAHWNEPNDDPQSDGATTAPSIVPHRQHVFDRHIARSDTPQGRFGVRDALHSFHDTRYRRVTYALDATTRYREFMPASVRADPKNLLVTSAEVKRWIKNTAPPPPPRILYVIPTFGWSRNTASGQKVSLRAGGGLRVYLDRPWFATGFGEMLAVVLPGDGVSTADADGAMKTLITQWGRDPIWTSAGITSVAPARSAFPLAKFSGALGFDASGAAPAPADMIATFQDEHANLPPGDYQVTGLSPPSIPSGKTVQVAPHAVGYDTDRQLWYCDIVIRPPSQSYYPFVRLALARYQPVSANGAYLSAVVTAEFQQLSPDRVAIVNQTVGGAKVSVAVYGFAPGDGIPGAARAAKFLARTQVLSAGGDADLDWRDAQGTGAVAVPVGTANTLGLAASSTTHLGTSFQFAEAAQAAFTSVNVASIPGLSLQTLLGPSLLWTWEGNLPPVPAGGRRRVLITESENYVSGEQRTVDGLPQAERIVYAEAVEI